MLLDSQFLSFLKSNDFEKACAETAATSAIAVLPSP